MLQAFVINLDRHVGRMRFMQTQLEALGVPFTRFQAVNGYDPARIADAAVASFAPLSGGEIGCWESHRSIWKRILDEDLPGAFVLADDVILSSDFARLSFPPEFLDNCDILKLDSFRQPATYGAACIDLGGGRHVQRLLGNERSTAAYFITRQGAERLLAYSKNYFAAIDEVMVRRDYCIFWKLKVWKIAPSVAVQARFELPEDALPDDIEDAIQTRVFKTRSDPKPAFGVLRKQQMRIRRLLDWDFGLVRKRREKRSLAFMRAKEGLLVAKPEFFTPNRAHIEHSISSAR